MVPIQCNKYFSKTCHLNFISYALNFFCCIKYIRLYVLNVKPIAESLIFKIYIFFREIYSCKAHYIFKWS